MSERRLGLGVEATEEEEEGHGELLADFLLEASKGCEKVLEASENCVCRVLLLVCVLVLVLVLVLVCVLVLACVLEEGWGVVCVL